MDQNTTDSLNKNVEMLFTNLQNFTQNEGVIGKPVIQENKTFLPVVSVTIGYGGGNSASKSQPGDTGTSGNTIGSITGKMSGGALGLGAKLNTEAVIVIDKDNVSLLPMNATAGTQLADKIPQMLMNMNQNKQGGHQNQQDNTQGQGGNTNNQ